MTSCTEASDISLSSHATPGHSLPACAPAINGSTAIDSDSACQADGAATLGRVRQSKQKGTQAANDEAARPSLCTFLRSEPLQPATFRCIAVRETNCFKMQQVYHIQLAPAAPMTRAYGKDYGDRCEDCFGTQAKNVRVLHEKRL